MGSGSQDRMIAGHEYSFDHSFEKIHVRRPCQFIWDRCWEEATSLHPTQHWASSLAIVCIPIKVDYLSISIARCATCAECMSRHAWNKQSSLFYAQYLRILKM